MWRQRLRGPFAFPIAKFRFFFRRTLSWLSSCCWCRCGSGGRILSPQSWLISWPHSRCSWPVLYALHCEAFDAVQNVLAAAGIRLFIKSPLNKITLRDAIVFVLIAVIIVPFGTAFWGAAFTISNGFGSEYWVEWRNLGISNGVTAGSVGFGAFARRRTLVASRK